MGHHTPSIPKLILALAAIVHVAYADYDDEEYYARGWDDPQDQAPMLTARCWYYSCHYNGRWHLTGPAVAGVVLFSLLILIFMVIIIRHCFINAHDTDTYYQSQNYQEAYMPQPRPRYSYPSNSPPRSSSASPVRQEMREHTRERRRYAAMPVVPLTLPQRHQNQASAPPPWEPREPLPAYMTDANNPKVAPVEEKNPTGDEARSDYSYR